MLMCRVSVLITNPMANRRCSCSVQELAVGGSYHYVKDHHRGDMVAAINMV
jgi:hypothetical protein